MLLETPNFRAIALIGNPSARCSRRISAQSSTDNTLLSLDSVEPRLGLQGVEIRPTLRDQFSGGADSEKLSRTQKGAWVPTPDTDSDPLRATGVTHQVEPICH